MQRLPAERAFRLDELEPDELLERLGERFRLRPAPARVSRRTFADTFDWRLHRAGRVLCHVRRGSARELELVDLEGHPLRRVSGNGLPGFREDLPAPLDGELHALVDVRRLLPLVQLEVSESEHAVLDDEGKTVARIVLEERTAMAPSARAGARAGTRAPERAGGDPAPLPVIVRVRPVRGYEDEFEEATRWLEHDLGLPPAASTDFEAALGAVGRASRDYSSKLGVRLDPAESAGRALKRVLFALARTIERNVGGTIADLDSEFLHDLRVATRRTRVALSQVKGVLDPEAAAHFRTEFRWLGGVTGPTRDLDVLWLKREEYLDLLAPPERAMLEPLVEKIASERRREQRKLARALESERFRELLAAWSSFLREPDDARPPAPKSRVPIGELARKRLRKAFARTIAIGSSVNAASPDADIHALRIQCKKLRYLLEFFRSLFASGEVDRVVKALKGLQSVLGDFNDYSVHRDYLGALAAELPDGGELALGALREHLRLGKERERERFEERFARFAGRENHARAERLFGKGTPG